MAKKVLISNSSFHGKKLAHQLGVSFFLTKLNKYPDTEKLLEAALKATRTADIIHYQFNNTETIDDQIFNLLSLVDKFADPRSTRLVLPYIPYGRANTLSDNQVDKATFLIRSLNRKVKSIYFVGQIKRLGIKATEKKKLTPVNIDRQIIAQIRKLGRDIVLVSPDKGFQDQVADWAAIMNLEHVALLKQRFSPTGVTMTATALEKKKIVNNKNCSFVVLDDIISTGNTLKKATAVLRTYGAKKISFLVIHDTRRKNFDLPVLCTNSLSTAHNTFDITPSILKSLRI